MFIRASDLEVTFNATNKSKMFAPSEPVNGLINNSNASAKKSKEEKDIAINLFRQDPSYADMSIHNTVFASKNSYANNYWGNPREELLKKDWYLILNDKPNSRLYLFFIPRDEFKAIYLTEKDFMRSDEKFLIRRSDKPGLIDLQIKYGDKMFTDTRSEQKFFKYYKKQLNN